MIESITVIQHTLYICVGHKIEEASEQCVGSGVSPSKVKIQDEHDESILTERRAILGSLLREERSFDF